MLIHYQTVLRQTTVHTQLAVADEQLESLGADMFALKMPVACPAHPGLVVSIQFWLLPFITNFRINGLMRPLHQRWADALLLQGSLIFISRLIQCADRAQTTKARPQYKGR